MSKHVLLVVCLAGCVVGQDSTGPSPTGTPDAPPQQTGQDAPPSPPAGNVRLAVTTTPKGGTFAPKNVVAVWVEDQNGTFIKTIQRWSQIETVYLLAWNAKAGSGDVDSVSGASRLDHATPLSIDWDVKGRGGVAIPDGMYKIKMESADSDATSIAQNNEGTFTFVKGPTAQSQTNLSNGGFTNVSIDFTPP